MAPTVIVFFEDKNIIFIMAGDGDNEYFRIRCSELIHRSDKGT